MKLNLTKTLLLLFVTTLLSSCVLDMNNKVNGNRNVITEDRTTKENFTKINIGTGLDLSITQGTKNRILVEADENLQEIIIVEVSDGILNIYSEKNIRKAKSRKIYVTIKDLESLTATSGADVYVKETLTVNNLKIKATSGANIIIAIDANSVETSATSGSEIEISGTSNKHATSATSGAAIDGYELESKSVIAKVTSGADINVFASESIDAIATSGGDIDFKGNPKKITKKSSSGGSVSPR